MNLARGASQRHVLLGPGGVPAAYADLGCSDCEELVLLRAAARASSVVCVRSGVDAGRDLGGGQLYLSWLVSKWPEVHALTSGACIVRQQLGTLPSGAHADPVA
jgi:hypothetical protein